MPFDIRKVRTSSGRKPKYKKVPKRTMVSKGLTRARISGSALGIPRQRTVKIRYNGYVDLTSTTGAMVTADFRANGAFDPSTYGAGDINHTPLAFVAQAKLYNHYAVLGSRISVQFCNQTGATGGVQPTICGVYCDDDATISSTRSDQLIENGQGATTLIGSGSANLYKQSKVSANFSTKNYFNCVDVKDRSDLRAPTDALPEENAFFKVWSQALGNGTSTVCAMVTIDYIVSFSEPKELKP